MVFWLPSNHHLRQKCNDAFNVSFLSHIFYLIPIVKRVGTGNEAVLCHAVFNTRLISGNDHFKRPSSNLADDCFFFFMALKKDS